MTQRLLGIGPFIGRQLDIVPFGTGIEENESQIRWPPDAATAMSVAGFNEAFNSSVTYEIDGQEIRLASVPGLAILKLIAWQDRHAETTKDAFDFERLLRTYEHVIGPYRLYIADFETLELSGFDPGVAAAFLLGSDMRAIATTTTLNQILTVMQSDFFEYLPGAIGDATTLLLLYRQCKAGMLGEGATSI
jgi:predicted nucleotidyltransferase